MEVWTFLLPILAVDVVNPVLFAFMVYAAGGARPALTSGAMLAGHTLAYLTAGIVIGLSLEQILEYLAEPRAVDFVIGGLLGCALLWLALRTRKDKGDRPQESQAALTPGSAFLTGAVINFVGIPFALPYFAAVDQLLKTDLGASEIVLSLAAYNLLYALPFLLVPAIVLVMGGRSKSILARINERLERVGNVLMPLMIGALGLALVADAASYFVRGQGLW
jgi:cytochrome c biogenesis protein CcdA